MSTQAVTVIGLGPMGRTMANVFLDHGYAVTVWNRTASRADELVARGATLATTAEEAVAANELVILSLTDYDAVYAVLEQAERSLAGKVVVNLSSDTPDRARQAAAWLAERGAQHLTGGVQVPPSGLGDPESSTFYSGPQDVFEAHRPALEVLTGTDYRGEDPGLAALYYQMLMDVFWTSMLSWLHALAMADANGISAAEFLPYAARTARSLPGFFEFYTPRIDAGEHPGDVDRLAMGVASVEHIVHTADDAGVDTAFPTAVLDVFQKGMAKGFDQDSFTSLYKVFRGTAG
ncbi:3-hydroxyisobutyrate dehydrogenase [Streptoalloteichus tenebrarius]|uniref:3-hydroxyisobutyrate dehydrogenase n=1 Tax=Streptoalloteichus tenebrarius (strain ATCC 17920 / DSM 40477 / JCM 4838 / CBS 697.72 / NBRC 16177 / NCIMB 11028 / NRRL B-12390 / A12253. 1 / ISP 5477) TaxID=1933 RepID=A0ABT1HVK2_STRSD|nr:NAD(P)-binding domain-containing protein [Streptoalloteichus tenebrarius]MCP2259445.1 3-hydroxyisobutyrate dehydrogenase [Streptoalloteichus tenebrarius]BFF02387.1 NAD(P)-binding domain-containing protein [Streptoalloteichus tenebrarius]